MSQKLCARTHKLRRAIVPVSLLGAIVSATLALGNISCEDKGIGRPCDVLTPYVDNQAIFNAQALECPSRICVKPALAQGQSLPNPPTGPLCSASCSQDSDCDGQIRDSTNSNDHRCKSGFACAIPFVKGPLCCQKLCICKDFVTDSDLQTPVACQGGGAQSCTSQ